jgi:hypothetical protein
MKSPFGDSLAGEAPLDPSGLKEPGIKTSADLNVTEARNFKKVLVKYFAQPLSAELAPFGMKTACVPVSVPECACCLPKQI